MFSFFLPSFLPSFLLFAFLSFALDHPRPSTVKLSVSFAPRDLRAPGPVTFTERQFDRAAQVLRRLLEAAQLLQRGAAPEEGLRGSEAPMAKGRNEKPLVEFFGEWGINP